MYTQYNHHPDQNIDHSQHPKMFPLSRGQTVPKHSLVADQAKGSLLELQGRPAHFHRLSQDVDNKPGWVQTAYYTNSKSQTSMVSAFLSHQTTLRQSRPRCPVARWWVSLWLRNQLSNSLACSCTLSWGSGTGLKSYIQMKLERGMRSGLVGCSRCFLEGQLFPPRLRIFLCSGRNPRVPVVRGIIACSAETWEGLWSSLDFVSSWGST